MTDFHTLYEQHAREVYRFALYLSGRREDAEDITSETFMRAWNSTEPIRQATVRAYLLTIAPRCYLKGMRRQSRHTELDEAAPDPARGPQDTAEQRLELTRVLAALQQLPEIDRAALLLRRRTILHMKKSHRRWAFRWRRSRPKFTARGSSWRRYANDRRPLWKSRAMSSMIFFPPILPAKLPPTPAPSSKNFCAATRNWPARSTSRRNWSFWTQP